MLIKSFPKHFYQMPPVSDITNVSTFRRDSASYRQWLNMESSGLEYESNILIGEALLELLDEGKEISCVTLLDKLKERAEGSVSEMNSTAVSLAVIKLKSAHPR